MSIIEKAIGKLDRGHEEQIPPLEPVARPVAPSLPDAPVPASAAAMPMPSNAHPDAAPPASLNAPRGGIRSKRIELSLAHLHSLGMVTPDSGKTAIAEEFRHIKRPLIEKAFQAQANGRRHGNLIMVTSSMPGEGKTFTSINLAMSIAMEMDHTVLLIDADVARPSVPRYLDMAPEDADHGLMDLLHGDKLDLPDVMLTTNVDRLRILPAGKSHKRATELLASQAMNKLLDELANRYPDRIIIFDSPPVLLTSEARTLASQMGQIVLVVEAESTTQHSLKDTLKKIGSHENVNLVYNKARAFPGARYYGGYY